LKKIRAPPARELVFQLERRGKMRKGEISNKHVPGIKNAERTGGKRGDRA